MFSVFIDGSAGTTGLRIYERLRGREEITLKLLSDEKRKDPEARREAINNADIVFLCLPDAAAKEAAEMCENSNTVIIDASTAHRTAKGWDYGFPELSEEHKSKIAVSKRIAVPGCHASGFISLVYPLINLGALEKSTELTCFSVTGYSGGGKKMIAEYEADGRDVLLNAPRQYGISQMHKHLPEMKAVCQLEKEPMFSPVVADFYSGMVVTVPLFADNLKVPVSEIKKIYAEMYKGPVVKYIEDFDENGFVSAAKLSGKDSMEISVAGNDERILLVSRYDNLGKGASGAAIECMNIVLGLPETEGLNL